MKDKYNHPRVAEELYDLENDPNELKNLAEDPDFERVVGIMKKELFDWIKYTNDPISFGRIPKQESSTFNY